MAGALVAALLSAGCSGGGDALGRDASADGSDSLDGSHPCSSAHFAQGESCLPVGVYVTGAHEDADADFKVTGPHGYPRAPVGALEEAIEIALREGTPNIYLCSHYTPLVISPSSPSLRPRHEATIRGLAGEIHVHGDHACRATADGLVWEPSSNRASLELALIGASGSITIDRVTFDGRGVGAVIERSDDVLLTDVVVAPESESTQFSETVTFALSTPPVNESRIGVTTTCPSGHVTSSGSGGTSNAAPTHGSPSYGAQPDKDGLDAPAAANGTSAAVIGRVIDGRWRGEHGRYGASGGPGQGGSGGAHHNGSNGIAGGSGGCGGAGGRGGHFGASSLGIISIHSNVEVRNSTILTRNGANAGGGLQGQAGANGGAPHNPGVHTSRLGGYGGQGARGGYGGGGAGGSSIGILYQGMQPALIETTIAVGSAGNGGSSSPQVGAGVTGVSAEVHLLPEDTSPLCLGDPTPCAEITSAHDCRATFGCQLDVDRCVGTPVACGALLPSVCDGASGCTLTP